MSQVVGLPNNSYKPITNTAWVRARLCKLQKGCIRLAAASDKAYQLLAHGRWFSPGTPASSTTKTGRHDIAKILLTVALNTTNQNEIFLKHMRPQSILAMLFRPFCFHAPKYFYFFCLSSILSLRVSIDGGSRYVSYPLNLISTLLLHFNEIMMISALYQINTSQLDLYSANSLEQQFVEGRHVVLPRHIIPIPNQPFFILSP